MPLESRRIAALLLAQPDEAAWRHAIEIDNILQKKAPATARRQATLIRKRLMTLDAQGWPSAATGAPRLEFLQAWRALRYEHEKAAVKPSEPRRSSDAWCPQMRNVGHG